MTQCTTQLVEQTYLYIHLYAVYRMTRNVVKFCACIFPILPNTYNNVLASVHLKLEVGLKY